MQKNDIRITNFVPASIDFDYKKDFFLLHNLIISKRRFQNMNQRLCTLYSLRLENQ